MAQTNPYRASKFKQLALPQQLYKFGGSSLANAKAYKKVARIISKHLTENDLIVVSASGQTTDWLSELVAIEQRENSFKEDLFNVDLLKKKTECRRCLSNTQKRNGNENT